MKKNRWTAALLALALGAGAAGVRAAETETEYTPDPAQVEAARDMDTGKVADASDLIETEQVGDADEKPVTGADLKDGSYDIRVESSSSMFPVEACTITVLNGSIHADLTLGGTGYLFLYPGTAEEASKADADDFIYYEEDADGKYVYRNFPVDALDEKISCAAFSKKKEQWYPRTLEFSSASLPADAYADGGSTEGGSGSLTDGMYTADVRLDGNGSVSAVSPMELTVKDGEITGKLVLDTSKADYVKVNGEKIDADEGGGGPDQTVFMIPVPTFDHAFEVIVDSTAIAGMNVEKEYSMTVDSASVKEQ